MRIDAELLLSVYSSVLEGKSALYCSAPITSGRRYVEWIATNSGLIDSVEHAIAAHPELHQREVVVPNLRHAREIVRSLRARLSIPVIDPTAVPHIEAWKQADWLAFWERVIERFAVGVVLIDDWQYSFGCTHEFVFAKSQGLPTYDEAGNPISGRRGAQLIGDALASLANVGCSPGKLQAALDSLLRSSVSDNPSTSISDILAGQP
jgi:hypothetical protein